MPQYNPYTKQRELVGRLLPMTFRVNIGESLQHINPVGSED